MDSAEFKRDFLEDIKTAAQVIGEGSSATFVQNVADYLIDALQGSFRILCIPR